MHIGIHNQGNPLKFSVMPAATIINRFVIGIENSNYEVYLLELINSSAFFLNKGKGHYKSPISEENGQYDAEAPDYEIDFKLLATQTLLMGYSTLALQPEVITKGVTFYTSCKRPRNRIKASHIHVILRDLSVNDLEEIRRHKTRRTCTENDIPEILNTIETRKNILLLLLYIFKFDNQIQLDKAIDIITCSLNNDFHNLLSYRKKIAPDFDTYLTAVYDNKFLIFEENQSNLIFHEYVSTSKTPTYLELSGYDTTYPRIQQ